MYKDVEPENFTVIPFRLWLYPCMLPFKHPHDTFTYTLKRVHTHCAPCTCILKVASL